MSEMKGSVIQEFVGLKPKMYSILYENKQKMSAKGVSRFAQTSLKHNVYREVLLSGDVMRSINIRIGSMNHALQTVQNNKVSLSAFDDKRFILNDGINCLPFGHIDIRDYHIYRAIADDDDWGSFNEGEDTLTQRSMMSTPNWSRIIREFNPTPRSNIPSI